MSLLQLTISKVDEPVFTGEVVSVTVPGSEGEMTVLANHEPFISALKAGIITIKTTDSTETISIDAGTMEVSHNQAIILI